MSHRLAIFIAGFLALMPQTAAWAQVNRQAICEQPKIDSCRSVDPSSTQERQKVLSCLHLLYACGQYQTIIDQVDRFSAASPPEVTYLFGAAYYGEALRKGSTAERCELAYFSKQRLESFLLKASDILSKPKEKGTAPETVDLDLVNSATKIIERVTQLEGCPSQTTTTTSLARNLEAFGNKLFQDALLGRENENSAGIAEQFKDINTKTREVTSLASSITTKVNDAEFKQEVARNRLNEIKGEADLYFGGLDLTDNGGFVSLNLDKLLALELKWKNAAETLETAPIKQVQKLERLYKEALGQYSPGDYLALRKSSSAKAFVQQKETVAQLNLRGAFLPVQEGNSSHFFWKLRETATRNADANVIQARNRQALQLWESSTRECGTFRPPTPKPWYCQE